MDFVLTDSSVKLLLIVDGDPQQQQRLFDVVKSLNPHQYAVHTAYSLEDANRCISEHHYSLVLVTVCLSDGCGLELIERLRKQHPGTLVLAMSSECNNDCVSNAIMRGAHGFLLKNFDEFDLSAKSKLTNDTPKSIASFMRIHLVKNLNVLSQSSGDRTVLLTSRELEVLELLARGHSNKEIARLLELSPLTIGTNVRNIYGKLNVTSRTAAVYAGKQQGLIG